MNRKFFTAVLLAAAAFSLTSCDEMMQNAVNKAVEQYETKIKDAEKTAESDAGSVHDTALSDDEMLELINGCSERGHMEGGEGGFDIINIQYNGEVHEYVYYREGNSVSLSHWAGCRFCKGEKF